MPSALRISSNTDNGFERILYWRTIGFFQGADTEKKRASTLSLFPHSDICECQTAFAWFKLGKVSGGAQQSWRAVPAPPSCWIPGDSLKEG